MSTWLAALALASIADPGAPTLLRLGAADPVRGRFELVADGPLAVRELGGTAPSRPIYEFSGVRVVGGPLRLAPGGAIRGGELCQVAPGVARARFDLARGAALRWHVVPSGSRANRLVFTGASPPGAGGARSDPGAAQVATVIRALAWRDGALELQADRPLVARVASLAGGRGYLLEFAGTEVSPRLARYLARPGGNVRRVRVIGARGGRTRIAVELERPAAYGVRLRGSRWAWVLEAPNPTAVRGLPDGVSLGLTRVLAGLRPRSARPLGLRVGAMPADAHLGTSTGWRASTHFMLTTNAAQFGPGPMLAGARHRYGGYVIRAVPALAGHLVGHVDAQLWRFQDLQYDYVNTLCSLAIAHPVRLGTVPGLHVFEGVAASRRQESYAATAARLDSSLFSGVGIAGPWPWSGTAGAPEGHWSASMVVDRMMASELRRSYYGQALRLRGQLTLDPRVVCMVQATAQRLDPVVIAPVYYREYLDGTLEWNLLPGATLGLVAQLGSQHRAGGWEVYGLGGPSFRLVF